MRRFLLALLLASALRGEGFLKYQPGTPVPVNKWVKGTQAGYSSQYQLVGYSRLVCPEASKACAILENAPASNSEYQHAMLQYSFSTTRLDVLDQTSDWHNDYMWPANHPVGYFVWNSNYNQIMYWGSGACAQALDCYPYTFWSYDLFGRTGHPIYSNVGTGTDPTTNQNTGMDYDPVHGVTILVDGQGSAGTVYEWADGQNQWTKHTTATDVSCYLYGNPTPSTSYCPYGGIYFPGNTFNAVDGSLYLMGGSHGGVMTNALWKYYQPTHSWTLLTQDGAAGSPSKRSFPALAWNTRRNVMMMVSGCTTPGTCAGSSIGDTWIYDPTGSYSGTPNSWTQITPAATYTNAVEAFNGLSYDEANDVFMLAISGTVTFSGEFWFYRLDAGSNFGYNNYTSYSYPPSTTAYSLNYSASKTSPAGTPGTPGSSDSWARNPAITTSGTSLYECHPEYGRPSINTNERWTWPYCQQYTGSTPTSTVPSTATYTSISGALTAPFQSTSVALTTVVPTGAYAGQWVAVDSSENYTSCYNGVPGSSCTLVEAGLCSAGSCSLSVIPYDGTAIGERPMALTSCNNIPTMAISALDRSTNPYAIWMYVKQWNGSAWVNLGGKIHRNPTGTTGAHTVFDASLGCDATGDPWIAWNEAYSNANYFYSWAVTPQVYVAQWNGTAWVGADGTTALTSLPSLNNSTTAWATDPSLTMIGSTPYVAWGERGPSLQAGSGFSTTGPNLIYAKTWNGAAWVTAGTVPINRNTNRTNNNVWGNPVFPQGWATHARLTNDGTNVWATWTEQQGTSDYAHTYVSQFTPGGDWAEIGSALNVNPHGSAANATIAMLGSTPVVSWDESAPGLQRQVYVAKYDPSINGFATLTGIAGGSITPGSAGPYTATQAVASPTFAQSGCGSGSWSATGLTGSGLSINSSTGQLSGTAVAGTYTATITYGTCSTSPTITINAAPSVTSNSLAAGTQGTPYSQSIIVAGGTGTVTCAGTGAPAGLTINAACTVTGTPSAAGSVTMSITPTDANGVSGAAHNVTLTINAVSSGPGYPISGTAVGIIVH